MLYSFRSKCDERMYFVEYKKKCGDNILLT